MNSSAAGALVITQRINKTYFPEQRVPERFPVGAPTIHRSPFRSNFLESIFRLCEDPNFAEEEYLTGITGMNLHQIHALCKQHLA